MSYKMGQTFSFQNKQYTIVGTESRSFVLECEGKHYKATAAKIKKMEEQEKRPVVQYPYLEHRIKRMRIWKLDAKLPTNEVECIPFFETLCGELSGENLTCDGELSPKEVKEKLTAIRATWRELETIAGRKFSEDEIESSMVKRILKQG